MTGPLISRDVDQRAQRHHLAVLVADLDQVDVLDAVAEAALGLDGDLPVPAELVEAVDVERAEVNLQGLVDVVERHAQRVDLGAVDVHEELRRVGAELAWTRRSGRAPVCSLRDQLVGLVLQGRQAQAAAVLDHELEAAGDAEARDRRRAEHGDLCRP